MFSTTMNEVVYWEIPLSLFFGKRKDKDKEKKKKKKSLKSPFSVTYIYVPKYNRSL